MTNWRQRKNPIPRRGLVYSLILCLAILGLGGVGFWLIDPKIPTLADGLWLAFTTAATVGYGDLVPSTHASRAFSVMVVLLGLAVLSLVTASVAAMFVDTQERQIERELMNEMAALRAEVRSMRNEIRLLHDTLDPSAKTQTPAAYAAGVQNPGGDATRS